MKALNNKGVEVKKMGGEKLTVDKKEIFYLVFTITLGCLIAGATSYSAIYLLMYSGF